MAANIIVKEVVMFRKTMIALATVAALGAVCTENLIRVDAVMESPKLAE
jgi:hypothetical protein